KWEFRVRQMRPDAGFWMAVRLLEFANLPVSRKNFESLFQPDPRDGGYTPTRLRRLEARAEMAARALGRPYKPRRIPPMPKKGGDLWQAFVRGVRRYGTPPTPVDLFEADARMVEARLALAMGGAPRCARARLRRRKSGLSGESANAYSPLRMWWPRAR